MSDPSRKLQKKILAARNSFELHKEKKEQRKNRDLSGSEDVVFVSPNSDSMTELNLSPRSRTSIASSVLSDDLRTLKDFSDSLINTPRIVLEQNKENQGDVAHIFTNHIAQLEDLVSGMRQSLGHILTELGSIQGSDRALSSRIDNLETRWHQSFTETAETVHSLKNDFNVVLSRVETLDSNQAVMQNSLEVLAQQLNSFTGMRFRSRNAFRRSRSVDLTSLAAAALGLDDDQGGGASTMTSSDPDSGVNTAIISTRKVRPAWTPSDQDSPISLVNEPLDPLRVQAGGKDLLVSGSPEDGYVSDASDSKLVNYSLHLCESLRHQFAGPRNSENSEHESEDSDGERTMESETEFKSALGAALDPDQELGVIVGSDRGENLVDISCQVNDSLLKLQPSTELEQCREITLELLRSEKHYCNSLWNLQENIYEPLKNSELVSNKDLKLMFPDELFRIYEQHCILLHKVEDRLIRWDMGSSGVADLYLKISEPRGYVFCLYADYVAAFPKITSLVEKYFVRSAKVEKYLKRHSRVLTCRSSRMKVVDSLQVGTFMIAPVQRIPQYILLFKRLMKHTPTYHNDWKILETVMENFKKFGEEMNSSIQRSMSKDKDLTPPIKPRRKQKRGDLHKKGRREEEWEDKSDSRDNKSPSPLPATLTPTLSSLGNSFYGKKMGGGGSLTRSRSSGHNSAAAIIRRTSSRGLLHPLGKPGPDSSGDSGDRKSKESSSSTEVTLTPTTQSSGQTPTSVPGQMPWSSGGQLTWICQGPFRLIICGIQRSFGAQWDSIRQSANRRSMWSMRLTTIPTSKKKNR